MLLPMLSQPIQHHNSSGCRSYRGQKLYLLLLDQGYYAPCQNDQDKSNIEQSIFGIIHAARSKDVTEEWPCVDQGSILSFAITNYGLHRVVSGIQLTLLELSLKALD